MQPIAVSVLEDIHTPSGAQANELIGSAVVWNQGSVTGPVYATRLFNANTYTSASVRLRAGIGLKVPSVRLPGWASTSLNHTVRVILNSVLLGSQ